MGNYTEFYFKAILKKETPVEVVNLLKRVIVDGDLGIENKVLFHSSDVFKPTLKAPFFNCERWFMLFNSTNFNDSLKQSYLEETNEGLEILINSELKNYDDEIDKFIEWISPYVKYTQYNDYLGYSKNEDIERQKIYYYLNSN